ncbi:MAG: alpha/beta hydrolase [Alphaproteobacteria bacterium]|nr:alpha/beta hydrolase [Alphaproteobacteria bacterium]
MEFSVAGSRVFAATGGKPFEGGKRTLVFLHGAGMDHTVWSFQARRFAHRNRAALAPDFPGHGRSGGEALRSIADMAAWVAAFVDALKIEETVLVGHSMGSLVALEAAGILGARARGLALIGTAARMAVHPDLLAAARNGEARAADMILGWSFGERGTVGGNIAPGVWMQGAGRRLLERALGGALGSDLAACDAYTGSDKAAARVRCPTVVVWGAADRMTPPAEGQRLASAIAGAKTVAVPKCGHMAMIEEPAAVSAAIAEIA